MRRVRDWLGRMRKRRGCCPGLPGARFERPEAWTETNQVIFAQFLKTPAGGKFLLTLHALVTDRALSVCDRTPYEHGLTGGMSVMLGEIERLAVEGEADETGSLRTED